MDSKNYTNINVKSRYDYSLLRIDYPDRIPLSNEFIRIICPIHGEFRKSLSHHLRGQGCQKCSNKNKYITTEEFIEKARNSHANRYDYSKFIYINAKTKGIIICTEHGEFNQAPSNHLSGCGCPRCKNKKISESRRIWYKEDVILLAKKCITRSEFRKNCPGAYDAAHTNGWLDESCDHMVDGTKLFYDENKMWIKENCTINALLFKTRTEFRKKSNGAYDSARKNGWLEECCKHMIRPEKKRIWTKEKCIKISKKFKTKSEWIKKSLPSYSAASKNNWRDECAKHMVSGK